MATVISDLQYGTRYVHMVDGLGATDEEYYQELQQKAAAERYAQMVKDYGTVLPANPYAPRGPLPQSAYAEPLAPAYSVPRVTSGSNKVPTWAWLLGGLAAVAVGGMLLWPALKGRPGGVSGIGTTRRLRGRSSCGR